MAIATAPVDFPSSSSSSSYERLVKPAPSPDGPVVEALRACPQLAAAPLEALRALARQASTRPVSRGTTLAAQGTRYELAILVVRGRVRAVCRGQNGREISVEVFRSGDLIADGVLAPDRPLSTDFEAAENGQVVTIPRDAMLACIRETPDVALAMAGAVVARLERSKQLATGLALSGVQERVIARLISLGRQDGVVGSDGLLVRNRPTQQELANQIGACRETVSRTVSELVRQGLLTPRGRSLLISRQIMDQAAGPA